MKYTIVVTDLYGKAVNNRCDFIDQKKCQLDIAFKDPNSRIIEVFYYSDKKDSDPLLMEKWDFKKPFFGLFGKPRWKVARDIPRYF